MFFWSEDRAQPAQNKLLTYTASPFQSRQWVKIIFEGAVLNKCIFMRFIFNSATLVGMFQLIDPS